MNTKYKLIVILSFLWLLVGCKKDYVEGTSANFIVTDVNSLIFKQEGETKYIAVTAASSSNWTIDETSYEKWIKAEREGSKIKVTADVHNASNERSTELTINIPDGKKTFTITQYGSDPVLKLKEDKTDFLFNKEGDTTTLNIIANTNNWTVQTLGEASWISWEKKDSTLTLKLKDFKKGEPGSTSNRKTSLFISNDTKHIKLNITQKGWAQFGTPIYKWNNTRAAIIAAEEARGHRRDKEFEKPFYPANEDVDKYIIGFTTDGEQTAFAVYEFLEFSPPYNKARDIVYLKAYENKVFNMNDLRAWLIDENKFVECKNVSLDYSQNSEYRFFLAKDSVTCMYHVFNDANKRFNFEYKGAYMTYTETDNYIKFDEYGSMNTFPVRNVVRLHDKSFKLEDVIAYEKAQGMIPNETHEGTKLCSENPNVKYASLVFEPENPTNLKRGDLKMVVYHFNYPQATNPTPGVDGPPEDISIEPGLEGTVGRRDDYYEGDVYPWMTIRDLAKAKGYEFVKENMGLSAYVRGEDEYVYVAPDEEMLIISFFKNKDLVKTAYEVIMNQY